MSVNCHVDTSSQKTVNSQCMDYALYTPSFYSSSVTEAIHVATWVTLLNMVLSVNIASYIDTRFWICSHLLWTSSIDRSLHSLSWVQDPHKGEGVHSRIGGLATTEYFPTCDSKWPLNNWGRTTKKRITFDWPHFIAGIRFCVSHLYFYQFLELLYQSSQYRKKHSPWTSYHNNCVYSWSPRCYYFYLCSYMLILTAKYCVLTYHISFLCKNTLL